MKKFILTFLAVVLYGAAVFGQSLANNEYFRKSIELDRQAKAAFEYGDYDSAADLAAQAQEYAEMSDLYVAKMLMRQDALAVFDQAKARYAWAESADVNAAERYPDRFVMATLAFEEAKLEIAHESYQKAIDQSSVVLALLADLREIPVFPAFYVVRRQERLTDCLWRIAELPEIYNDPLLWPELYKANRAIMPQPSNPDLILPGMVLRIPSLRGEKREGTWDPDTTYPVFGKTE